MAHGEADTEVVRRLILALLIVMAVVVPGAMADTSTSTFKLDAQATYLDFNAVQLGNRTVMGCDTPQSVFPGWTRYLVYPGELFGGTGTNPGTSVDLDGGRRAWHVSVFVGWYWHHLSWNGSGGITDTGDSTQRFGSYGNDTHDNITPSWTSVGTRRYISDSGFDGFSYEYGLKVVNDGSWPMNFSRADC